MTLQLKSLAGEYWVAQAKSIAPNLIDEVRAQSPEFWTISESMDEISIVSKLSSHATFSKVEGPWSAFRIVGQLDFALTGILAQCSALLADAKISIFAISTFDTDYFLVRQESKEGAISAWTAGGLDVVDHPGS